jgi:tellurite resistance protein TehA-like permease
VGLIMWGYAVLWIVFAVVTIASRFPRITFSMAWWGFTFPLGKHLFTMLIQVRSHFVLPSWEKSCR